MDYISNNLKRVRLINNYSLKKAGELLNMTSTAIMKYENGTLIPNSKKLIEFAKAYNVKVSDLLKKSDYPELKFNSFRKKKKLTGKKLEILKLLIQEKVSNYLFVLSLAQINESQNSIIDKFKCNSIEDAEKASVEFRKKYNLSNVQPLSDLINTLENIGIIVIKIPNENKMFDGFDGLSEVVNGIPIIVLCDDIKDGARERFTIAHELGHIIIKTNENVDEEKICNRFASSLLMPKEAMIHEFGNSRSKISYQELMFFKAEYKVSIAATIYRLKELGIINEYTNRQLNILISTMGWKKEEPFIIDNEKTNQYKKLVHRLEIDNIISISKACELLGVTSYEYNSKEYNCRY